MEAWQVIGAVLALIGATIIFIDLALPDSDNQEVDTTDRRWWEE